MNILVTGAAGYIGSHTCARLIARGHHVLGVDGLYRGHLAAAQILKKLGQDNFNFVRADIADRFVIESLLSEHRIDAVMHFAALTYVGESVDSPMNYYRQNVTAMNTLLDAIDRVNVQNFVFSSSCATYGQPPESLIPIPESCPQEPLSPYGRTKLAGEWMMRDLAESRRRADRPFAYAALRYFNVAGCALDGSLGEDHTPETHLIPVILQAALGQRESIQIFGTDYPTPDGTCIRDYVHVDDLADAHIAALESLKPGDTRAFNLGIGEGVSVRQVIDAAKRVTGVDFKVIEHPRRAGDPARLFSDSSLLKRELGWSPRITSIDDTVKSAWNWFKSHPNGYRS